jgi:flagellar biosynthesis protein FlhB
MLAPWVLDATVRSASDQVRVAVSHARGGAFGDLFDVREFAGAALCPVLPMLFVGATVAVALSVAQTGGALARRRFRVQFAGFGSSASWGRVARSSVLLATVISFAVFALRAHAVDIAHTVGRPREAGWLALALSYGLAKRVALFGVVVAAADVVLTQKAWRRRLQMSKAEKERERKDAEGDPHLKAARAGHQRDATRDPGTADVPSATVVVTDGGRLACALRYDESTPTAAPVLVAKGRGTEAARIAAAAIDHGVPIIDDARVARALCELSIGAEIPFEIYEDVACILQTTWQAARNTAPT